MWIVVCKHSTEGDIRGTVSAPGGRTVTYQVIDTHNANAVVAEYPTWRRAFNASKKLEGTGLMPDSGWRYPIRVAPKSRGA